MSRYRCAVSPVPAISRASRTCASRRARGQGGRTLRLRTTLPPGSGLEEKLRLRTWRGLGAGACVGAPRLRREDSWTLLYGSSSFGAPGSGVGYGFRALGKLEAGLCAGAGESLLWKPPW